MEPFPGNSRKAKVEPEKKVVASVVNGKAVVRKKPLGRRLKETFIQQDAKSAWSYVVFDVLLPSSKDMVVDAIREGSERIFYGESRRGSASVKPKSQNGYVNYAGFSSPFAKKNTARPITTQSRATHNFDEIVLDSRTEAEAVISGLAQLIEQYKQATVADLYDLVAITGQYTDEKWGWTDISSAGISRVRAGFLLDLPRPEQLD